MSRKAAAAPKKATAVASQSGFNEAATGLFFDSLADLDDPELISMEGISKLCDQLNIDPNTDVRVLVLMWKLGAISKPGSITRSEFLQGMKALGKSDSVGLSQLLPSFDPGFLDRPSFRGHQKISSLKTF